MHLFTSVCICLPLCLSVFLVAFLAMCLKTHVSWHYFFKGPNHDWRLVVTFWQPWWVKTQPVFVKNVPLKTTRCVALGMKHCADHRNSQRTNAELLRSVERTSSAEVRVSLACRFPQWFAMPSPTVASRLPQHSRCDVTVFRAWLAKRHRMHGWAQV